MIAINISEKNKQKTEVYTTRIPNLACILNNLSINLVEGLGEQFAVIEHNPEMQIKGRKLRYDLGHFDFAPEVQLSIYEGQHFARVYLDYKSEDEDQVQDVRQVLLESGLTQRFLKKE